MSKEAQLFLAIFLGIVTGTLLTWFLQSALYALRANPKPIWFLFGLLATLFVESLGYLGLTIFRRWHTKRTG